MFVWNIDLWVFLRWHNTRTEPFHLVPCGEKQKEKTIQNKRTCRVSGGWVIKGTQRTLKRKLPEHNEAAVTKNSNTGQTRRSSSQSQRRVYSFIISTEHGHRHSPFLLLQVIAIDVPSDGRRHTGRILRTNFAMHVPYSDAVFLSKLSTTRLAMGMRHNPYIPSGHLRYQKQHQECPHSVCGTTFHKTHTQPCRPLRASDTHSAAQYAVHILLCYPPSHAIRESVRTCSPPGIWPSGFWWMCDRTQPHTDPSHCKCHKQKQWTAHHTLPYSFVFPRPSLWLLVWGSRNLMLS